MNFRTGTEISAAARSVHCRNYFLPPTHTKGFLQYHTARPGPARLGSDQARSGLISPATERKPTACLRTRTCFALHPVRLGPARPGSARHGPGPPRPRSLSHTVFHTPASKDLQDQYGFPSGWPRPAQAPRTHGLNTPRPGTGNLC